MIYQRPFWLSQISRGWKKRPIVWLSGGRRTGKTTLAGMIPDAIYMNCDLPSVARQLQDPESFYDSLKPKSWVVFDEVHRLENPSQLLKIGADSYQNLRILATGSSTLSATRKFRDSLTGRKTTLYLPPVLWTECLEQFKVTDLDYRLLRGGLPEALLAPSRNLEFYSEWLDSFYARDIQELFVIRNRTGFMKLLRLLMCQSGGLLDYTKLGKLSELSRPTVMAHVEAVCIAHALFLLPPFSGSGRREIIHRPKAYAFDTGFVTFCNGWSEIREEIRGILWEHMVLDILRTFLDSPSLYFWRDKSEREIDFVVKGIDQEVHCIECKINPDEYDIKNLKAFRLLYPQGNNYLFSPRLKETYLRKKGEFEIYYTALNQPPPVFSRKGSNNNAN